jgi:anti-sigma factor RsiW
MAQGEDVMMHEDFRKMASRRLDLALEEKDRAVFEAHLAACPECRAYAVDMEAVKRGLAAFPEERPSAATDRFLLEQALAAEGHKPASILERFLGAFSAFRPSLAYAAAAMVIGAFAGGIGYKLIDGPRQQAAVPFISEEEAGLFDPVYPGSIAEVLGEVRKERL